MWTVEAFQERNTTVTITELNAVPSQIHFTSDDDLRIGRFNSLIGACAIAFAIGDAYLTSPSMRAVSRCYIAPLYNPGSGYVKQYNSIFDDRMHCPIPLETNEALNAFIQRTLDSDVYDPLIGVWLADGPVAPVVGDIRTIKMSATGTYPQLAWTYDKLSIEPDLPTGRYAIVGARAYVTDAIGLVRFVFPDMLQRPGLIAISEADLMTTEPSFRKGRMGVWGEFETNNPPGIEILPVKDADDCNMRVDVMKVG